MTLLQKLQLEQSKLRQSLSTLLSVDSGDRSDEQRAEILTSTERMGALETEIRTAKSIADDGDAIKPDDGESRELRGLQEKANIADYIGAATSGRGVAGAAREFNQALSLGDLAFPLQLLAGVDPSEDELRTTSDVDTATRPRRWIDRLFHDTAAAALGLTFDTVPSGVAAYPITKTGGVSAQRGREQAIANSAWTIGTEEIKPTRQGIHYQFAIEDAARIAGLESAIERDMRAALRERLDFTIFQGDDTANEDSSDIAAITGTAGIVEKTITQTNKVKGPETLATLVEMLDGLSAETLADLRAVAFVGANQLWRSTNIAGAAAQPYTMAKWLMDNGFNWRVRGGIETATGNGKLAAMLGLARGLAGAGVVATWAGATLIRDPYSGAAKGQVQLTLQTLWNYKIVRASNFAKVTFVT